jgi:hypothetical protein
MLGSQHTVMGPAVSQLGDDEGLIGSVVNTGGNDDKTTVLAMERRVSDLALGLSQASEYDNECRNSKKGDCSFHGISYRQIVYCSGSVLAIASATSGARQRRGYKLFICVQKPTSTDLQ